jgi:hypothetical protein
MRRRMKCVLVSKSGLREIGASEEMAQLASKAADIDFPGARQAKSSKIFHCPCLGWFSSKVETGAIPTHSKTLRPTQFSAIVLA